MKRSLILFASFCMSIAMLSGVSMAASEVSLDQARQLVVVALSVHGLPVVLEHVVIKVEPDFIFFEQIDPDKAHLAVMGTYAVNRRTAEVWDTGGHCSLLQSAGLAAAQRALRSQLGLSAAELGRGATKKPECDAE